MAVDESNLDTVVQMSTAQGAPHGSGVVVAYHDHPTVTVETADGERQTWKAALCHPVPSSDAVAFWRDRALRAESRLLTDG